MNMFKSKQNKSITPGQPPSFEEWGGVHDVEIELASMQLQVIKVQLVENDGIILVIMLALWYVLLKIAKFGFACQYCAKFKICLTLHTYIFHFR